MKSFVAIVCFFGAVFCYVAGVFPLGFFGIGLPAVFYALLASRTTTIWSLFMGALGGIVIDTASPIRFGAHAAMFVFLGIVFALLKRYFERRYPWGDIAIIWIGLIIAGFASEFLSRTYNTFIGFELTDIFLNQTGAMILLGAFSFFWIQWIYRRRPETEGELYVV